MTSEASTTTTTVASTTTTTTVASSSTTTTTLTSTDDRTRPAGPTTDGPTMSPGEGTGGGPITMTTTSSRPCGSNAEEVCRPLGKYINSTVCICKCSPGFAGD